MSEISDDKDMLQAVEVEFGSGLAKFGGEIEV